MSGKIRPTPIGHPRPKVLDLYCAQGGAARGYQNAGFDVTGVDTVSQPRYCGDRFFRGDALEYLEAAGHEYDLIHASPPCDAYTKMAGQHGTRGNHPKLIGPTRGLLEAVGKPYVIENVETARTELRDPILLCGEMKEFNLTLFRHRLFEMSGFNVVQPIHSPHRGRVGVGGYVTMTGNTGGRSIRDGIQHGRKSDWETASGIDWMTVSGLREALPPAYTEYLGRSFLKERKENA